MRAGRIQCALSAAFLAVGLMMSLSNKGIAEDGQAINALGTAEAEYPPVQIPACANDRDKLGISRIVEIDTTGGGIYGNAAPHNNFLNDHEVILTFDDGPLRGYTRRVLQALDAHCTRGLFFMVGRMAAGDPAMVKEVIAAGHTVGTHTYSHKNLKPLGFIKGRNEFEMGVSAVTKAAGQPVAPFFRFPYLSENRQMVNYLKSRDTAAFFIDIDSKDYQTRNPTLAFNRIMAQLDSLKKGIILMHDIQPSTAGMIRQLLDTLHAKGYKVVQVVPKRSSATVASYDSSATQAASANDAKLKEKPLADRSVVWTMSPPTAPSGKDASVRTTKPVAGTQTGSISGAPAPRQQAKNGDNLPWTKPTVKRAPAQEELPWQARVFAN